MRQPWAGWCDAKFIKEVLIPWASTVFCQQMLSAAFCSHQFCIFVRGLSHVPTAGTALPLIVGYSFPLYDCITITYHKHQWHIFRCIYHLFLSKYFQDVFHHQQSCFSYAGCVRRSFLSADFVFVGRFLSSADCFLSVNVFADAMEMMLKPAYSVLCQPVSWWNSFCLRPARILASITIAFVFTDLPEMAK